MKVFSNDSFGGSTTIPEGVLQRYLRGFNNDTYYLRGFNNETWGCSATIPERYSTTRATTSAFTNTLKFDLICGAGIRR